MLLLAADVPVMLVLMMRCRCREWWSRKFATVAKDCGTVSQPPLFHLPRLFTIIHLASRDVKSSSKYMRARKRVIGACFMGRGANLDRLEFGTVENLILKSANCSNAVVKF